MTNEWVKVYSSQYAYKIEIIKALLGEQDIESVVMNKMDSSYLFGEIELYVKIIDIIKAKQIIDAET